VIADANGLCEAARADEWHDLERDTQSLREQLQALRNRVLLMRRKLSQIAAS
jgi:homoserine acetyltransferase